MNDDLEERLDDLVRSLDGPMPPPGFAARIVRAHHAGRRRRRMAALAAVAAAACGLAWIGANQLRTESGRLLAARRETVRVGRHAIVAEAGASLRWTVHGR